MTREQKPYWHTPLIITTAALTTIFIIISSNVNTAYTDSSTSQLIYGCARFGPSVRCDPLTNKFNSIATVGHVQSVTTVNITKFDPREGVFGNALQIQGFKQQYVIMPNIPRIDPSIFSVSVWIKQDPAFRVNSSIISHVNSEKTAGWYLDHIISNSQSRAQFSVTNSNDKIFSVSSPIDTNIFTNVIGVFGGRSVKIYVNGFLAESVQFAGKYVADPNVPLTIGLNSYDYGRPWTGAIDEMRIYSKAISDNDINRLTDYGNYSQSIRTPTDKDDGLIGYWPFDDGILRDKSANQDDGKIIAPALSMVSAPDRRLFFSVRDAGEIRIMNEDGTVLSEPFVRLHDPSTNLHEDIFGIAIDPDFSTNHYLYAYVTPTDTATGNIFGRVIRFTELDNKAVDQKILLDNIPAEKGRIYAGAIAFGPDNKLFITTGYVTGVEYGQNLNTNLTGKVLRINRDGTIPLDNPFHNSPVYSLGHRNMFGIAFESTAPSKAAGSPMGIVSENGGAYNDEINVLKKGGNYGFPFKQSAQQKQKQQLQQLQSSSLLAPSSIKYTPTDNSSAILPARTYYKLITPTQAIFYDGNKFPALKNKFLIASYSENSMYALTLNSTGSITEELAIRLPEVRGHLIAIAKAPNGDIYLGGENIYKLVSLDNTRNILTYFVGVVGNSIAIKSMSLNLASKVLSIDYSISNKNNDNKTSNYAQIAGNSPSVQITVPKALLSRIYNVTSEKYNSTSSAADKAIDTFKIKEKPKATNVGDTIVDIKLKSNTVGGGSDKILIKAQTPSARVTEPHSNNNRIILH